MNLDRITGFVDDERSLSVQVNVFDGRYRINRRKWFAVTPIIPVVERFKGIGK
ncbi:MAG: hypothetical protein ABSF00_02870 [Candidatus Bathyarchaeia archaeon]